MNNSNISNIDFFENKTFSLKELMLKSGVANSNLIKGCSPQEITEIERENDVSFPESYKAFLKYFGHGLGGHVMYDMDITSDKILGLTDFLRNKVLIEKEDPSLPEKAFVFSARYGEQFLFFDCGRLEKEKSIFYYQLDDEKFTSIDKTILDFLESQIELSISLKRKREEKRGE